MYKYKSGDTTVIIHSTLPLMSSEERRKLFEEEKAKGNPVIKEITEAIRNCYKRR
ncbi:hypothetical protein [Neobacillus niacini]|uniref:hypothetical protein n=1 Tax=Neobacillus niacini TaxID=86668 RepID=UPI0028561696|nr:hypothetical protein [Neobacillus niacini]MDR7001639.1 hypothetical protein [Neobacillus niacini]